MGTVQQLAATVKEGLPAGHPKLRKTGINKRALAVGALLAAQTPNPSELANLLPLPTEQQEVREPWLRRRLNHPLLQRPVMLEPFARTVLREAARTGQPIMLSLAQPELGDRFAILMLAVPVGDRSLPLAGKVEARAANLGFAGQQGLRERVRAWLPVGATGLLLADRFYPSTGLFAWLDRHDWQYRRRLKGNLTVATGLGAATPGELAAGVPERYLPAVRLFNHGVSTNLGMWQEAGHEAPWIIAMDCRPTRAAVQDSGARWLIEPTF